MARICALKLGDIKGDIDVADFKDQLRVDSVSVNASSQITYDSDGGGNVDVHPITLIVRFGNWLGDIQKASFGGQIFDQVVITEIDQKNEGQNDQVQKAVRSLTLTNAYISNVSTTWYGSSSTVSITLTFEKFAYTYNAKSGAKMASRDLMATT